MANYRIPKEISSELKINKALYLTDLFILLGTLLITYVMARIVYPPFQWFFYAFMGIVAVLMIIRPASNPKKRMYQAIYLAVLKKNDTYSPIDYIQDEESEE